MNTPVLIVIVLVVVAAIGGLALMSGVIPMQNPSPTTLPTSTPTSIVTSPTTVAATTSLTTATTIPATTTTPAATYNVSDCSLLTVADITSVLGVAVVNGTHHVYLQGTCSRGWHDEVTGTVAGIGLSLTSISQSATQTNLNFACVNNTIIGMDNIVAVSGLGDYVACWYKGPYDSVNFGKGAYQFQLQCTGTACSQAKAVQLAQIVVSRVS